jgi:NADPH:quinone reductase-like Zn-dependent oxidoreductase
MISLDIVGRVEKVGAGVETFSPGERVIGVRFLPIARGLTPENERELLRPGPMDGRLRQYIEVPARWVIRPRPILS